MVDNADWLTPGDSQDHSVVVKRVIGVGGDTLSCCDGQDRIQVDGKSVTEGYLAKHPARPSGAHQPFPSAVVPSGQFFLAGDDRSNSLDSRMLVGAPYGKPTVAASAIKGRVVAIRSGSSSASVPATTAFVDAGLLNTAGPDTSTGTSPAVFVAALAATAVGVLGLMVLGIVALGTRRRHTR